MKSQTPSDKDIQDWKSRAESEYDRLEAESNPDDRLCFYLERLEVVTSHLADVVAYLGTRQMHIEFGRRSLFVHVSVCASRISSIAGTRGSEDWQALWRLFQATLALLQDWSGASVIAAQCAKIIFVSAVIARELYESPSPSPPRGIESKFGLCAQSLPFTIDTAKPLMDQRELAARNLGWVHGKLKRSSGI